MKFANVLSYLNKTQNSDVFTLAALMAFFDIIVYLDNESTVTSISTISKLILYKLLLKHVVTVYSRV
jgi:hypothetical protein